MDEEIVIEYWFIEVLKGLLREKNTFLWRCILFHEKSLVETHWGNWLFWLGPFKKFSLVDLKGATEMQVKDTHLWRFPVVLAFFQFAKLQQKKADKNFSPSLFFRVRFILERTVKLPKKGNGKLNSGSVKNRTFNFSLSLSRVTSAVLLRRSHFRFE